jgi:hypothetical protein
MRRYFSFWRQTQSMSTNTGSFQSFEMHPALLRDVIKRQTGSLDRAVLEAAQNSVDAGASAMEITLTRDKLVVSDNGRGFTSSDEILANFKTFGRPHEASEAKVFGTFRMGRGQLMAYGINIWKTNQFQMIVDLGEDTALDKLGFELTTLEEPVPGCQVTVLFYRTLSNEQFVQTSNALQKALKWLSIPVYMDGQRLNEDFYSHQWQYREGHMVGDFSLTEKQLSIYNMGVHVKDVSTYMFGLGGTLVSLVPLSLNFARNDILESCPSWQQCRGLLAGIRMTLEKEKSQGSEPKKKSSGGDFSWTEKIPTLTVTQRKAALAYIVEHGEALEDHHYGQPLLLARYRNRKWISPRKLVKAASKTNNRVWAGSYHDSIAADGERFGLFTTLSDQNRHPMDKLIPALNKAFGCELVALSTEQAYQMVRGHVRALRRQNMTSTEETWRLALNNGIRYLGIMTYTASVMLGQMRSGEKVKVVHSPEDGLVVYVNRDVLDTIVDFSDCARLGITIATALIDHKTSSSDDAMTAEQKRQWAIDAHARAVEGLLGFANSVCNTIVNERAREINHLKTVHARIMDQLAACQQVSSDLRLWKGHLVSIREHIDKILASVEVVGEKPEEAA